MKVNLLKKLPHEVLLQIFKYYLDLHDLCTLTRVSRDISRIAVDIIKKQWGIELYVLTTTTSNNNYLFKTQANIAMIILNDISHKFINRIKIYDPYAFPPFISIPNQQEQTIDNNPLFFNIDATAYDLAIPQRTNPRNINTSLYDQQQDTVSTTFPPTIEPDLDDASNDLSFMIERFSYHSKRLHSLLLLEHQLHQRILSGLSDYMHGYKIEYPLRTAIDILFHHAIFVSSRDRLTSSEKIGTHHGFTRTFAAATSRLLCEFQSNFSHSSEVIGAALWDNINTCLIFTEYRLLAVMKQHNYHTIPVNYYSDKSVEAQPLLYLLYTITALFDVIGACYVSYHIKDEYAIPAIRKICALLDKVKLSAIKKSMLKDLVDVWLNIDIYMTHSNLRSIIQDEMK